MRHYLLPDNTLSLLLTFPWYPSLDRSHGTDFAKQLSSHLGSKIHGWALESTVSTDGWACLRRQHNWHKGSCAFFNFCLCQFPWRRKEKQRFQQRSLYECFLFVCLLFWSMCGFGFFPPLALLPVNSKVLLLTPEFFIRSLETCGINLRREILLWLDNLRSHEKRGFYSSLLWGERGTQDLSHRGLKVYKPREK